MQLSSSIETEDQEYRLPMQGVQTQLIALMIQEKAYLNGLHGHTPNLLNLIKASGAAICTNGEYIRLGQTPDEAFLARLADWLAAHSPEGLLATNHLSGVFPEALAYSKIASGLLAITVSREHKCYLLWFRPEVAQSVTWSGNPKKPIEIGSDGTARMTPRKSFAAWQEAVQNKSLFWMKSEIEAAHNLSHALISIELAETNAHQ